MFDPANARLDAAQLDAFYRSLQGYDVERRDPLPPIVRDLMEAVVTGYILPDLGHGWADSAGDRKSDKDHWSEISRVFLRKLAVFFGAGPENRSEVLSVIYHTLLTRAKDDFKFHSHQQATRYFARSAANTVQKLIDPDWRKNTGDTRAWMRLPDSLDTIIGTRLEPTNSAAGPQRNHATVPRPESRAEHYVLQESIRKLFKKGESAEEAGPSAADLWLVLHLLLGGGYRYAEIVAALHVAWPDGEGVEHLRTLKDLCLPEKEGEAAPEREDGAARSSGKADDKASRQYTEDEYRTRIHAIRTLIAQDEAWSHPDRVAPGSVTPRPMPRHPLSVWNDLREGYRLPDYLPTTKTDDAICRWMPPPTLTEGSLRVFYSRGLTRLKRCFASGTWLRLWLNEGAS